MVTGKTLAVVLATTCWMSFACSKRSDLVATWKEPTASPGPYRSVVAIALAKDEPTRQIAEDELVRRLGKGTKGVSSYKILSKEEEEDVDKLVAKLKAEGIEAAAVMRLVEENVGVEYDPGSFYRPSYQFHSFYHGVWAAYHDPGYLTAEVAVRIETAFYGVGKEELVWTGYSQTLNPKSARVVIDDVARLVVQELRREKLVD